MLGLILLSRPQGIALAELYDATKSKTARELEARTLTLRSLCNMGYARITRVTWGDEICYYRITAAGRRAFPCVDVPEEYK